jgi:O-antigen/teichoic acid export membrane protein
MKKKLIANAVSSFFLQITTVICGFILPRLIINTYGSETNGLVNSISQFLQIIAFLELGVGAVVQSALYKPLAERDNDNISKTVASANRFFKRLAGLLLIYVVVLILCFPYVAEQKVDFLPTALLIASMSISSFAQYYFGIVNQLLLTADQRGYIQYNAQTFTLLLNTIASIVLIKRGASIQMVKFVSSGIFVLRPIILRVYVKRHYHINQNISYTSEPISQKWNGVAQHIATVITGRADVVVLTAFRPFAEVSVYSVYQMVATGVQQLFMSMTTGFQAMIGRLWAMREEQHLKRVFGWMEWGIHTGTVFIFGVAGNLILPFVRVYTQGVTDAKYNQPHLAMILLLAQAAYCIRLPNSIMILAGGHYKQTQKYYFIAAIINIVVSLVAVRQLGINGVALGTLSAMLFHNLWMTVYNAKNFIKWPFAITLKQLVVDAVMVFFGLMLGSLFHLTSYTYMAWIILAIKVTFVWAVVILIFNFIFYKQRVIKLKEVLKGILIKVRQRIYNRREGI